MPSSDATRELAWYRQLNTAAPSQHVLGLLDSFTQTYEKHWHLYMVFDFMDTDLWDFWSHRHGLLTWPLALDFLQQVCRGLAHLHSRQVVHGDLSLKNILISRESVLNISDLGMSFSALDVTLGTAASSQCQRNICTAPFRSPELWFQAKDPKETSDLWSLGVIAVCLLTGSMLFKHGREACAGAEDLAPFLNLVRLAGPIEEETMPGCSAYPRWLELQPQARGVPGEQLRKPQQYLTEKDHVKRPLRDDSPGLALVLALLVLPPRQRLPAEQAVEHPLFGENHVALASALRELRNDSLASMALTSVQTGRAIQQADVWEVASQQRDWPRMCGVCGAQPGTQSDMKDEAPARCPARALALTDISSAAITPSCACTGNCGRPECKRGQKVQCKPVCSQPPCTGATYCSSCKCEDDRCLRPRNAFYGRKRWCRHHGEQLQLGSRKPPRSSDRSLCRNKFGVQPVPKAWTATLRLIARCSFALERMPSEETRAFLELAQALRISLGSRVTGAEWAWLSFACTVRWPPCVRAMAAQLQCGVPDTPSSMAAVLQAALEATHGVRMRTLHATSNTGHSYTMSGLLLRRRPDMV